MAAAAYIYLSFDDTEHSPPAEDVKHGDSSEHLSSQRIRIKKKKRSQFAAISRNK